MAATQLHAGSILGTVTLDTEPGWSGLGGGEFTAFTGTGPSYVGNYASSATYTSGSSTGFDTFCVETGVTFSPGTKYYYSLGQVAAPGSTPSSTGAGVTLTAGAAWLYYEFAKGALTGFNYTDQTTRTTDDNLLQSAIWMLQNAQTDGNYGAYQPVTTSDNSYYKAAITQYGSLAGAEAANANASVQILQMWTGTDMTAGEAAQNQLVLVPDGGMTVALLGGALVGLQALRRKLA
jgi:hypothetical protein